MARKGKTEVDADGRPKKKFKESIAIGLDFVVRYFAFPIPVDV